MEINFNSVKSKIKKILLESVYTQKEWSNILNVSQPSISNYINGRMPPIEILVKIAKTVEINLEDLLFDNSYTADNDKLLVKERSEQYMNNEILQLLNKMPATVQNSLLALLKDIVAETNR